MTQIDNSIAINLFNNYNNNIIETYQILNSEFVSCTKINNFNSSLYFKPTPFGNYFEMCKCTVGNKKYSYPIS